MTKQGEPMTEKFQELREAIDELSKRLDRIECEHEHCKPCKFKDLKIGEHFRVYTYIFGCCTLDGRYLYVRLPTIHTGHIRPDGEVERCGYVNAIQLGTLQLLSMKAEAEVVRVEHKE